MISLNKSNQKNTLCNVSTHICKCPAVQSSDPKSLARTEENLCKIIFPKNKTTIIILMTVVIQYDTSHLNLKSEDLSSNTFVETKTSALWAKLGGQVVVIFKPQNKKMHFISLFSKILETNIEPS